MEKLKDYESAILHVINQQRPVILHDPACYVITDKQIHHYQILLENWNEREKHELQIFMHFHLKPNGKVYILENHSSNDIGEMLLENGVEKSDIVLAFLPTYARKYSGYAVA
jgi:XisI protein